MGSAGLKREHGSVLYLSDKRGWGGQPMRQAASISLQPALNTTRACADKWGMKNLSSRIERVIAGLVLGVAFLVMASIIVPHDTQATPNGPSRTSRLNRDRYSMPVYTQPRDSFTASSINPHEGLFEIGSIESDCYLVRIYSGASEPLYTVIDLYDGSELATLFSAEHVEAMFPDLPITTMDFGTPTGSTSPRYIMLSEPKEHEFH